MSSLDYSKFALGLSWSWGYDAVRVRIESGPVIFGLGQELSLARVGADFAWGRVEVEVVIVSCKHLISFLVVFTQLYKSFGPSLDS